MTPRMRPNLRVTVYLGLATALACQAIVDVDGERRFDAPGEPLSADVLSSEVLSEDVFSEDDLSEDVWSEDVWSEDVLSPDVLSLDVFIDDLRRVSIDLGDPDHSVANEEPPACALGQPCEDDGEPCTVDVCDGDGRCSHISDEGVPCVDDGNECTEDVCGPLVCEHVARVGAACDEDGNACTQDVCREDGRCGHVALPDATVCGAFPHFRCCGGACVNIVTDDAHCAGCGLSCGGRGCVHFPLVGAACACAESNAQCQTNGPDLTCYMGICNCQSDADCRSDLGQHCAIIPGHNFCTF